MIKVLKHPNTEIFQLLFASATLVDFPQFRDIHHLIPHFLDQTTNYPLEREYYRIEDSDKWEIYVEYRKIVSEFLIDHIYSESWSLTYWPSIYLPSIYWTSQDSFPVNFFDRIYWSQKFYVSLAKYLLSFLSEGLQPE